MRRIAASVLLALFGFTLVAGAVVSDPDSQLPACCRRHGKHHCGAPETRPDQSSGPDFQALRMKCPSFPATTGVTGHSYAAGSGDAQAYLLAPDSHPAGPAQTESRRRVSVGRSCQKRGPPSILS